MEYLVENIRRIKEIEPNWLDIVKKNWIMMWSLKTKNLQGSIINYGKA